MQILMQTAWLTTSQQGYQTRLADGDVATKAEWENLYQQAYP